MKNLATLAAITVPLVIAAQTPATGGFAQAPAEYPKCSLPCLAESMTKTTCNSTDTACICADQPVQEAVAVCVLQKCTVQEALTVKNITNTVCDVPVRDRSETYIIVANILLSISAVLIVQRFAYKLWAGLDFGWDDWFCLATIITGIPATVLNVHWLPQNGLGRDVWTLTPSQITKFGLGFYITAVIYFFQVVTLKLSLLFFYIRIFPTRPVSTLLWSTVAFVATWGTVYEFLVIFQCTPISYFWTRWDGLHHGHCIDINALVWSNAGLSIATDLWMLAIPMWQLRTLQLDWRRKVGVGLMFGVGTFVTVVSILRLRSLVKFRANSQNPMWEFFDVSLWSDIEINIGMICICMPSLRLLLVRLFPKLRGTTQRYYAKYSHSGNKSAPDNREHRGFGTVSTSRAEPDIFQGPHELNQISYKKSYTVNYGEPDDAELVLGASDMDMRSAKSLTSISARGSSDKAPHAL
ncbi:Extracellular membrane protein, CFEM domain protein [Cordyceps fumosorosea ARSEF 2679]|uniref:Extracellular membrane protein, CFEM domain protein n=1 Tax=Cordyceps fumosorosea (strain ARSEF 2679) TaxID=1081104 RepID=A0A167Q5T5_CORFA|nr:Extracellular membrane protein, CFEM domain protein [Cordyceps fumosorosea ARSEF 2679]OAA57322.1 Extracellular membrane protein, CFEM domain protein [Cordyceps fumosorosea ARSEF 2679]